MDEKCGPAIAALLPTSLVLQNPGKKYQVIHAHTYAANLKRAFQLQG
jgi:hypothetical protein